MHREDAAAEHAEGGGVSGGGEHDAIGDDLAALEREADGAAVGDPEDAGALGDGAAAALHRVGEAGEQLAGVERAGVRQEERGGAVAGRGAEAYVPREGVVVERLARKPERLVERREPCDARAIGGAAR